MGLFALFDWDSAFNMILVLAVLFLFKGAIAFDNLILLLGMGYLVLSESGLNVLGTAFLD